MMIKFFLSFVILIYLGCTLANAEKFDLDDLVNSMTESDCEIGMLQTNKTNSCISNRAMIYDMIRSAVNFQLGKTKVAPDRELMINLKKYAYLFNCEKGCLHADEKYGEILKKIAVDEKKNIMSSVSKDCAAQFYVNKYVTDNYRKLCDKEFSDTIKKIVGTPTKIKNCSEINERYTICDGKTYFRNAGDNQDVRSIGRRLGDERRRSQPQSHSNSNNTQTN